MLAGLGRFPEREVASAFFLIAIVVYASASLDAADVDLREFAVVRKFGDAVVDRTFAGIGVRFLLKLLNQGDHIVHGVGGAVPVLGLFNAQRFAIVEKGLNEFLRVVPDADAGCGGPGDNAVVHVG